MLIPYQAEVPVDREPAANIILMLIMSALFVFTTVAGMPGWLLVNNGSLAGFFLHSLGHSDFFQFAGNVLFLWTFGNALNEKLGNSAYAVLFFAFALLTGTVHSVLSASSAAGAGGAISGLMGTFILFYPHSNIACLWLLTLKPVTVKVRAVYILLIWILLDLYHGLSGTAGMTYSAYLAGYFIGLVTGFVLKNRDTRP